MGKLFNIQKYSVNDGPGIRTLAFFKGCPLSCKWCSNPESQKMNPEIMFFNNLCKLCGACEVTCENNCISVEKDTLNSIIIKKMSFEISTPNRPNAFP